MLAALEIISPDDDEHAQIAIETMAEIRMAHATIALMREGIAVYSEG